MEDLGDWILSSINRVRGIPQTPAIHHYCVNPRPSREVSTLPHAEVRLPLLDLHSPALYSHREQSHSPSTQDAQPQPHIATHLVALSPCSLQPTALDASESSVTGALDSSTMSSATLEADDTVRDPNYIP